LRTVNLALPHAKQWKFAKMQRFLFFGFLFWFFFLIIKD